MFGASRLRLCIFITWKIQHLILRPNIEVTSKKDEITARLAKNTKVTKQIVQK